MINLFDDIPTYTGGEIFADVLLRQAFVSSGSSRLVRDGSSSTTTRHADEAAIARINAVIDELIERCRRDLEKDGVTADRQKFQKLAECR